MELELNAQPVMARFNSPECVNTSLRHVVSALGLSYLEHPPPGAPAVAPPGSLLVAIDLENVQQICALRERSEHNINAQLGVSIFDPLQLRGAFNPDLIRSTQFVSGHEKYTHSASNKFLFGETIVCKSSEFAFRLASILPHDRPFLLLGHIPVCDRASMRKLGLDIESCPKFAGLVDTYPMSGDVFHIGRAFGSLGKILTCLGVGWDRGDLHNGGNDAHYTLRAALMLARRGYLESCLNPTMEDEIILEKIRTLAMAPAPERRPAVRLSPERVMADVAAQATLQQSRELFRAKLEQARLEMEMGDFGTELLYLPH